MSLMGRAPYTGRSDARENPDHDGLSNRVEQRLGLEPRDADTDGDGLEDGDDFAGVIADLCVGQERSGSVGRVIRR